MVPDDENVFKKCRLHPKHNEESLKTVCSFNQKVDTILKVFNENFS